MRMTIVSLIVLLICVPLASGSAQVVKEDYTKMPGLLRIGPEPQRQIWLTERGYTLILPDDSIELQGVAIFFQRGKIAVDNRKPEPASFDYEALTNGVAILHLATGNPLDFFFDDSSMVRAADKIEEVIGENSLEQMPLLFAGLSLGGTRAVKFAQFLYVHKDDYNIKPAAIAVVDAPLDMQRFWYSEKRQIENDFHPAAADEGRWVTYLLEQNLGGAPDKFYDNYADYSPYTHTEPAGGNIKLLIDTPVRAYHEPDIDWWVENRRKNYYDMNSIDMAAMITTLKLLGNDRAELITTHNQRNDYEKGSSPHTWSFIDNADLIKWFLDVSIEYEQR